MKRAATRARVWDVPVRAVHATFIVCVAGAWMTRGAELADLHSAFGYSALAALALRLAWGFGGPRHARFASFAYGPGDAIRYLADAFRGSARHYTGHNPAGSWGIFLILGLLGGIVASGLVASGGMHHAGPLAGRIAFPLADAAFTLHEALAWGLLAAVALHLAGVAWGSFVHRENLALAMATGRKQVHGGDADDAPARTGLGAALIAACVGGSIVFLAWHVPREARARAASEAPLKATLAASRWGKECGSCHLAYPPALLPPASWRRMMAEQDRHFGEDLSLSAKAAADLLAGIGGAPPSWAAWKLASSAHALGDPQRISTLPAWVEAHRALPESRYAAPFSAGRHDCEACHRDASSGIFHPRMIRSVKPENIH
ncbi:MAG TPA: cytochrome b/b6 domain-containing protein [Usitatibacter sp.]|nr:cytochrome b/b6 domain-containing protein [Usitatibacter sp.]